MTIEIKVPSPGESITEVQIARWIKSNGEYVEKDEEICEIDSDKATLAVSAESSGELKQMAKEGDTVKVGSVLAKIDTSVSGISTKVESKSEVKKEEKVAVAEKVATIKEVVTETKEKSYAYGVPSISAKKIMDENNVKANQITGSGKDGRITKTDVMQALSKGFTKAEEAVVVGWGGTRDLERKKMTALRKKLAQRLVAVKNQTAMLTTFNEVDMSPIMNMRSKYKDQFQKTYGVGLGFMSFFTKAVTEALKLFPAVNAQIEGEEIVYYNYADVGIAVSAPKGLMVPILRNAETMSLAQIELTIKNLATKARDGKLSLEEISGGTFTITNGGVFGSMLSTPILNPPQSAILGMHNIVERPVAINGKVEIRPIMYVALSYDHRVIDGRESVGFLVKVKEMLENPTRMLFGGKEPAELVLGL